MNRRAVSGHPATRSWERSRLPKRLSPCTSTQRDSLTLDWMQLTAASVLATLITQRDLHWAGLGLSL